MSLTPWSIPWLKATYLAGVRDTAADGTPYADELYQMFLDGAVQWAKTALDIECPRREIPDERHDYEFTEVGNWWLLQLDKAPVRNVRGLTLQVGTMPIVSVPYNWILQPSEFSTMVQVIPNPGELSSWAITAFGYQTMTALASYGRFPGWYAVDYDAGYEVSELPLDVLDLMGKYAACPILDIANDQVLGAGIKSASQSQDGLSKSKTVGGFAERAKAWRDQIERDRHRIRRRFHGVGLRVA